MSASTVSNRPWRPSDASCRWVSSWSSSTSRSGSSAATCRAITGADRAAGAGDQHPAAPDEVAHRLEVELHLVAAEEVLDPEVAHVAQGAVAFDPLRRLRQHPDRRVGPGHGVGHAASDVGLVRDGEQHLVDVVVVDHAARSAMPPATGTSSTSGAAGAVVVDHRDRDEAGVGAALHLPQRPRHRWRPHRRRRPAARPSPTPDATEREQPRLEADEALEHHHDHGPDHEHQRRHVGRAPAEDRHQHHATVGAVEHDAAGLVDAGVLPRAAVAAPEPGGDDRDDDRDREEHTRSGPSSAPGTARSNRSMNSEK